MGSGDSTAEAPGKSEGSPQAKRFAPNRGGEVDSDDVSTRASEDHLPNYLAIRCHSPQVLMNSHIFRSKKQRELETSQLAHRKRLTLATERIKRRFSMEFSSSSAVSRIH